MEFKDILYKKEDGIATITLNRPKMMNCMSSITISELSKALNEADMDDEVKVVVITGAGAAFCAGDDISEFQSFTIAKGRALGRNFMGLMLLIERMAKPVIAAVNGIALAGGFELALACDITIASDKASFGSPEPKIGAVAAFAAVRLPQIIGAKKARELLLTSDVIDAKEAERLGIVNKVVPAEELQSATKKMAEKIKQAAPISLWLSKNIYSGMAGGPEMAVCSGGTILMFGTEDFEEGFGSFLQKRKPQFKGK